MKDGIMIGQKDLSQIGNKMYEALRPYQKEDVNRMCLQKRGLNYLDMRLGKSLETLTTLVRLQALPALIVCPKFALGVWASEIEHWTGLPSMIYAGTPRQRAKLWEQFALGEIPFLITTFAMTEEVFSKVPENYWQGFVADEIHLAGIFNHKTKTYKTFHKYVTKVPVCWLLTGTPYRQGCIDLYGPLSIVDPKRFTNYWSFRKKWCVEIPGPFGVSLERLPKNLEAWRTMVGEYMLRRRKAEVFRELPPKLRQVIPMDMNPIQKKAYDELVEEMFTYIITEGLVDGELIELTEDILMTPSLLAMQMRLRQLLVAPQMLGFSTRGTAIDALVEMSADLLENGEPIVVYTCFRQAIPFFKEALQTAHPTADFFTIQGGLTPSQFTEAWQGFQECKNKKKILFCVIKSGAAFKASAANTGFFLGCEWDFNLNEQAEDRMFSPDKTESMICYYFIHNNSVEEIIKNRLNTKKFTGDLTVGTQEQYENILEHWQSQNKKRK